MTVFIYLTFTFSVSFYTINDNDNDDTCTDVTNEFFFASKLFEEFQKCD